MSGCLVGRLGYDEGLVIRSAKAFFTRDTGGEGTSQYSSHPPPAFLLVLTQISAR